MPDIEGKKLYRVPINICLEADDELFVLAKDEKEAKVIVDDDFDVEEYLRYYCGDPMLTIYKVKEVEDAKDFKGWEKETPLGSEETLKALWAKRKKTHAEELAEMEALGQTNWVKELDKMEKTD